jgi:hypothetical protein
MILTFAVWQSFGPRSISAQEDQVLNLDEVTKNTDPATATNAQIKTYSEQVKGKQDRGEGVVVDILPPRARSADQARVTILTPASNPGKGYNVVLYTSKEAMSELKISDKVSFEGKIQAISSIRGVSIDVMGTYKKLGEK